MPHIPAQRLELGGDRRRGDGLALRRENQCGRHDGSGRRVGRVRDLVEDADGHILVEALLRSLVEDARRG
ncbi:hypothetical protein ACFPRL_03605 [Pseudoclavibacter helvolus]